MDNTINTAAATAAASACRAGEPPGAALAGAATPREQRNERIASMYRTWRLTPAEIAQACELTPTRVRQILQAMGAWRTGEDEPRRREPVNKQTERNTAIAARWRAGETAAEIGESLGITRARVQQILRAQGLGQTDGGAWVGQQQREQRRQEAIKARLASLGVSAEEREAMRRAGATRVYNVLKRNVRRNARGVAMPFELTLGQWWAVWKASGRWAERGGGRGQYYMAPVDRTRGYVPGNVIIRPAALYRQPVGADEVAAAGLARRVPTRAGVRRSAARTSTAGAGATMSRVAVPAG